VASAFLLPVQDAGALASAPQPRGLRYGLGRDFPLFPRPSPVLPLLPLGPCHGRLCPVTCSNLGCFSSCPR
jgi:hypothetical protein